MRVLKLAMMLGAAAFVLPAMAAEPSTDAIIKTYGDIALAAYSDALTRAEALDVAVDALITTPTDATLKAARDASRVP